MKLMLIGDERVGKSTLVRRLEDKNSWTPSFPYHETVGADFRYYRDGSTRHEIWDLAGNQRHRSLLNNLKAYGRHMDRLLLVVDVSRPETYDTLISIVAFMFETGSNLADVVLLHNKIDVPEDDAIDPGRAAVRATAEAYFPSARFFESWCGAETSRDELRDAVLYGTGLPLSIPRFMRGSVRLPQSLPRRGQLAAK